MDALVNILNQISPLSEKDQNSIREIISEKELKIGEYWFHPEMYANQIAYITKGYLRKYLLVNGKEKTDYFYFDNDLTGDLPSIISKETCKSYNEAMEPTSLLVFSYHELDNLSKESRNIERLLRVFAELAFVRYYYKATSFILKSPKERYEELINTQPEVLQRATQYHIASYLGITPQHLSRLRATK